ncbi:MAG: hypothetical protein ABI742_15280 [Gemmatimonadota bacterium]
MRDDSALATCLAGLHDTSLTRKDVDWLRAKQLVGAPNIAVITAELLVSDR